MKTLLRSGLFILLILGANQTSYSQTLFMGDESSGIGLQYQYSLVSGQPITTYALGFSIEQDFDVVFIFTNTFFESTPDRNEHRAGSGSIQFTFFPAREENKNEVITAEMVTGIGVNQVHQSSGLQLMFGTGVSKVLLRGDNGTNLRPRVSAGYTLTTINQKSSVGNYSSSSERTQVGVGVSVGAELFTDIRLGERFALLLTPSLSYFLNERDIGIGFSSSIIF